MHTIDLIPMILVGIAVFLSAGYLALEFIRARKA